MAETKEPKGDVVYIGCKMPNGVTLNLTKYDRLDPGRDIVRRVGEDLPTVTLRGNGYRQREDGSVPNFIIDGYAFTSVPKDFWEAWYTDHRDMSLVTDGLLIVADSAQAKKSVAREHEKLPGQFERLQQEGDPRVKALGVEKFQTEDA